MLARHVLKNVPGCQLVKSVEGVAFPNGTSRTRDGIKDASGIRSIKLPFADVNQGSSDRPVRANVRRMRTVRSVMAKVSAIHCWVHVLVKVATLVKSVPSSALGSKQSTAKNNHAVATDTAAAQVQRQSVTASMDLQRNLVVIANVPLEAMARYAPE